MEEIYDEKNCSSRPAAGYEGKIWKDDRPAKLTDEHGYTSLKLKNNPYYGNGEEKTLYFLDLNGIIFHVPFVKNSKPKESTLELFKGIYGGIEKITASSELSEKTKYFGTDMWPYKGNHGKDTFEEGGYFYKLFNGQ